jgi:hypothetical protein
MEVHEFFNEFSDFCGTVKSCVDCNLTVLCETELFDISKEMIDEAINEFAAAKKSGVVAYGQTTAAAAPLPPPAPLPESSVKAMLDAESLLFGR